MFLDANDNAVLDGGETGLAGVMLTLSGTDDQGHPVTTHVLTDADGTYAFIGLLPGTYTVTETQPQGSTNSTGSSTVISGIVIASGSTAANNNFAIQPLMILDVRTADGGKTATVTNVGQVITLKVYAILNDSAPDAQNVFVSAYASFMAKSLNGGAAQGDLSATVLAPYKAGGYANGTVQDLDGDGGLDVGSNNSSAATGWFCTAANMPGVTGKEHYLGDLTFTVTSLQGSGETDINAYLRHYTLAYLWTVNGTPLHNYMLVTAGAPVVLTQA